VNAGLNLGISINVAALSRATRNQGTKVLQESRKLGFARVGSLHTVVMTRNSKYWLGIVPIRIVKLVIVMRCFAKIVNDVAQMKEDDLPGPIPRNR
jgi:hypothetical protein